MSTLVTRPVLSYEDVRSALNSSFFNMTKHGPCEDDLVSPNDVFQAVAAALQVTLWNMVDNDLEEVTFRQME